MDLPIESALYKSKHKKIPEKRHVMPPFRDISTVTCFCLVFTRQSVRPYFLSHKSNIGTAERNKHQCCQAGQMRPYEQQALSET